LKRFIGTGQIFNQDSGRKQKEKKVKGCEKKVKPCDVQKRKILKIVQF
jgi:hypothetical protein